MTLHNHEDYILWSEQQGHLTLHTFHAVKSQIRYLITTCCTVFLFINYCSDKLRPQFLGIFNELIICATYLSTYLAEVFTVSRWKRGAPSLLFSSYHSYFFRGQSSRSVKLYLHMFPRSLKYRPIYPRSLYICMNVRGGTENCLYLGLPRLLFSITTLLQLCALCKVEREVIVSEEVKMIRPQKVVLHSVAVGTKKIIVGLLGWNETKDITNWKLEYYTDNSDV